MFKEYQEATLEGLRLLHEIGTAQLHGDKLLIERVERLEVAIHRLTELFTLYLRGGEERELAANQANWDDFAGGIFDPAAVGMVKKGEG